MVHVIRKADRGLMSKLLIMVIMVFAVVLSGCGKKENPQVKADGAVPPVSSSETSGAVPGTGETRTDNANVATQTSSVFVTIEPKRPTSLQSLKAKVVGDAGKDVVLVYSWRLNDGLLAAEAADTLSSGVFKKGDSVVVIVTAFRESKVVATYQSLPVVIVGAPPVLNMSEVKLTGGDMVEIQLRGESPDGAMLKYALEPPLLAGMTINAETGRAIWKLPSNVKNSYQFTASASDADGAKSVRTFEFHVDVK